MQGWQSAFRYHRMYKWDAEFCAVWVYHHWETSHTTTACWLLILIFEPIQFAIRREKMDSLGAVRSLQNASRLVHVTSKYLDRTNNTAPLPQKRKGLKPYSWALILLEIHVSADLATLVIDCHEWHRAGIRAPGEQNEQSDRGLWENSIGLRGRERLKHLKANKCIRCSY